MLESNKYIKELKLAASNILCFININNLRFSVQDFCELVISAKNVKKLYIQNSLIPLDSKFEFGPQLDTCQIVYLNMFGCGEASYCNWESKIHRFDNLLEAISKCAPLKNSLKTFRIKGCAVSKSKAEEIRKKYDLNELKFDGV